MTLFTADAQVVKTDRPCADAFRIQVLTSALFAFRCSRLHCAQCVRQGFCGLDSAQSVIPREIWCARLIGTHSAPDNLVPSPTRLNNARCTRAHAVSRRSRSSTKMSSNSSGPFTVRPRPFCERPRLKSRDTHFIHSSLLIRRRGIPYQTQIHHLTTTGYCSRA
jgi:hypothetical protein